MSIIPFVTTPSGLAAIARRRLKQVAAALARCVEEFEELDRKRTRVAASATRLRAERQLLVDVLDRRKVGQP